MTTPPRPELFQVLEEFCRLYPHWRFGQMIANIASLANNNIWDLEDEELIAAARPHIEHRKRVLAESQDDAAARAPAT